MWNNFSYTKKSTIIGAGVGLIYWIISLFISLKYAMLTTAPTGIHKIWNTLSQYLLLNPIGESISGVHRIIIHGILKAHMPNILLETYSLIYMAIILSLVMAFFGFIGLLFGEFKSKGWKESNIFIKTGTKFGLILSGIHIVLILLALLCGLLGGEYFCMIFLLIYYGIPFFGDMFGQTNAMYIILILGFQFFFAIGFLIGLIKEKIIQRLSQKI